MIRERILQTVTMLFARYGIKGVTMHQIAATLGISKKTIYEEFSDKETLVELCLQEEVFRLNKAVEKSEERAASSLEAILYICSDLFSHFASYCPAFYKDLKHYPESGQRLLDFLNWLRDRFTVHFQQGVEQGDFLPDKNYEFLSSIFIEQIGQLRERYQWTIITTFLRGICTPGGMTKLNGYTYANYA